MPLLNAISFTSESIMLRKGNEICNRNNLSIKSVNTPVDTYVALPSDRGSTSLAKSPTSYGLGFCCVWNYRYPLHTCLSIRAYSIV